MCASGPEFTWRRHIGGWWDRIKKAALPGQKRSSFVVDFDTAMQDTEHAIKQIAYALDLPGWGHDDAQDDWQAKVVDKHTQYGEVKESISVSDWPANLLSQQSSQPLTFNMFLYLRRAFTITRLTITR